MFIRIVLVLLFVGAVFGGIFAWKQHTAAQMAAAQAGGPPPAVVAATTVARETWRPHLQAVGFFEELADEAGNRYRFTRNPVRLSDSEVPPALPPRLGEHTREVLAEAGLPADAIDRLVPDPKETHA